MLLVMAMHFSLILRCIYVLLHFSYPLAYD